MMRPGESDLADVSRHCNMHQAGSWIPNVLQLPFTKHSSTSLISNRPSRRSILPFTSQDLNNQSHTCHQWLFNGDAKSNGSCDNILLEIGASYLHGSVLVECFSQRSRSLGAKLWIMRSFLWQLIIIFLSRLLPLKASFHFSSVLGPAQIPCYYGHSFSHFLPFPFCSVTSGKGKVGQIGTQNANYTSTMPTHPILKATHIKDLYNESILAAEQWEVKITEDT